jgi:uncharacterized membrane protein
LLSVARRSRLPSSAAFHDRILTGLNFAFLLGIVLQPFTTNLVSSYGSERLAMLLDAGLLAMAGQLLLEIWVNAAHNRGLVPANRDPELISFYTLRALIPAIIFLVCVGLILALPVAWAPWIPLVWLLIIAMPPILRRMLQGAEKRRIPSILQREQCH